MSPAPSIWVEDGSIPCSWYRNLEATAVTVADRMCRIRAAARVVGIGSPDRAELSRIRSGLLSNEGGPVVRCGAAGDPVQVIRRPTLVPKASLMAGFSA